MQVYQESNDASGEKVKTTRLNADMLLRTGLAQDLELTAGLVKAKSPFYKNWMIAKLELYISE